MNPIYLADEPYIVFEKIASDEKWAALLGRRSASLRPHCKVHDHSGWETKRPRFVLIEKTNALRCLGDEAPRFVLIEKANALRCLRDEAPSFRPHWKTRARNACFQHATHSYHITSRAGSTRYDRRGTSS